MLIYAYKGKKSLNNEFYFENDYTQSHSFWKLYNYFGDLKWQFGVFREDIIRQIYRTYTTLCRFNNVLVDTYEITESLESKISFVKKYLQENQDITNSYDEQCKKIYNKLKKWYNRILENPNCLDEIKWEVAHLMKFYERQEIYRVASVNLKRNYYDFCV